MRALKAIGFGVLFGLVVVLLMSWVGALLISLLEGNFLISLGLLFLAGFVAGVLGYLDNEL